MLSERILSYLNDYERRHADWGVDPFDHWAVDIAVAVGASTRATAVALTHLCGRGIVTSTPCKGAGKLYALTNRMDADSPQEASDA